MREIRTSGSIPSKFRILRSPSPPFIGSSNPSSSRRLRQSSPAETVRRAAGSCEYAAVVHEGGYLRLGGRPCHRFGLLGLVEANLTSLTGTGLPSIDKR